MAFPYGLDATGRTARPADAAAHARQLLEQVLLTSPGERVMRPGFGTGAHQLVFEPSSGQAATAAQHLVGGALQQWLTGWVDVQSVDVEPTGAAASLTVTVRYVVRATGESDVASFSWGR
jgi:hypothetical protein